MYVLGEGKPLPVPGTRRRRRLRGASKSSTTSSTTQRRTEIVVVASTESYRNLAGELPNADDAVLEIGCSTGLTTRMLAQYSGHVVAVDVAAHFVDQVQTELAGMANVTAVHVDGRDLPALVELLPFPDLIFVDIGGDAQLDNVVFQVRQCLLTFTPRTLVVKSVELGALCSLITSFEAPDQPRLRPRPSESRAKHLLTNLLDLSRSSNSSNRAFAARKLRTLNLPEADRRLAEMVEDSDARVRRIVQLWRRGHPSASSSVVEEE